MGDNEKYINRLLMSVLIVLMVAVIGLLLYTVAVAPVELLSALAAFPTAVYVVYLALGYFKATRRAS